jgi:putative SOS response-associated peptidase YedK
MCGRFTLRDPAALRAAFKQFTFPEFSQTRLPRYNIAPSQTVLGVRNDGREVAEELEWGIRGRINIRAESIAARRAPVRRRCITFADGFYEWKNRRPYYYTLASGAPFALAGLWEPLGEVAACDIATCEPNALVAPVHDRMPAMLSDSTIDRWLDPQALRPEVAASILRPFDPRRMRVREVSARVNSANYDAPDVLEAPDPRLI